MFGYQTVLDKSMNGVKTLSDGKSIISDGIATHNNIVYTSTIKSSDVKTTLTNDTITTENLDVDSLNATNISANSETVGILTCTTLNADNYGFYIDGFNNNVSSSLPITVNNNLKVVGDELTIENSNLNQIGTTTTNNLKTTSINGTLTCQSDLVQTGGNTVLKNITCDNLTMNNNKSIAQSGAGVSNSLGNTQISHLVVTSSMSFPSSITIPDAEQTGDLTFTNGARIIQDLSEAGDNYNTLMYSKISKADINGNLVQISGNTTLLNTTIQGTAEIQGDIEQTAGQCVLKAIGCDQITLNVNKDIYFNNGTGKIDQSVSSGVNLLNGIVMNANNNLQQSGTGILSQSGTGTNALKNTSITGTLNVSSSTTLTGNVQCDGSFSMGANRSITQPLGTTNNQLQATTISNLTCSTANISTLSSTNLSVGNVSNTEIQYLDGVIAPIQSQINSISTTASGNSTAITGISYNSTNDTTTIDNNVTLPTGKNLLLGTTNVQNSLNTLNSNFSTLNTAVSNIDISLNTLTSNFNNVTSGITYSSVNDTTTIDNNVTINKKLIVDGMDIKADIDALELSFTTGTINSTSAVIANLSCNDISCNTLFSTTEIKCKEFCISNDGAAVTAPYNSNAIIAPSLTHGMALGTGDGATLSVFNVGLYSWYGTGFVDACFKVCNAVINHRTGDFITNGAITCANVIVNTLATIANLVVTNLTATNITSPTSGNINITTANGRNLYINNNKGINSGDVYFNTSSQNANIYVNNGSVTVDKGNLELKDGIVSSPSAYHGIVQIRQFLPYPGTTNTRIQTSFFADADCVMASPHTYFGVWFIDAGINYYKLDRFRPVPCSVSVAGTIDDCWIVCPGYKVVLYRFSNYGIIAGERPWSGSTDLTSQTRTIDNTTGTTFVCIPSTDLYNSSNQVGSCKVYFKNTEITMSYLS